MPTSTTYIMYLKAITSCAFRTKFVITLPSSAHVLYNVCNSIHSTLCGSLNQQKPNPKRHSQRLNYKMDTFQGGYMNRPTVATQLRQYELITAQFKQQLAQVTSAKTNYCLYTHLGIRILMIDQKLLKVWCIFLLMTQRFTGK